MRILHTADWHVGKTLRNRSRAEEHRAVISEIVAIAVRESVDIVLVAGDIFDTSAPTPEAEEIVYDGLLALAGTGAEVVVVAGNHDHPRRLQAVAPLLKHVHVITGASITRPTEGGVATIRTRNNETACIALVPFISQRGAVRAEQLMDNEAAENVGDYQTLCGKVIDALCTGMSPNAVRIVVAHLHVLGGKLGGGERQAHTVLDYYIPPQKFPATLHYVALGHLHAPQRISGPCPIWYSGAPLQLDFGESEIDNGVLIVDVKDGTPAEVRQLNLEAGRHLKTLKGTLAELSSEVNNVGDAYLRLILDEPPRIGLADEARELFPNAVDVVVARSISENSREELEGHEEVSPRQLFATYLEERGELDTLLLEAFDELMEKVYAPAEA